MGILRPDMKSLLWLAIGVAIAAYVPAVTRFLPRKG
jgi:hypothetical protein